MDRSELQTTLADDLLTFVENSLPKLDKFRLEITRDTKGAMIAELVPREPEPQMPNA